MFTFGSCLRSNLRAHGGSETAGTAAASKAEVLEQSHFLLL
jgi:hypothetical protein